MANNSLDTVFAALADPTRRAIVAQLTLGAAPVSDLAKPHSIALPSFLKHLGKLEAAGLVTTHKQGRVRTCALRAQALSEAVGWIEAQRKLWETRLDALEEYLSKEDDP
jgi:DNA-binding transcriptional ArsR family regulator